MDINLSSSLITILSSFAFIVALLKVAALLKSKTKKLNLPPGPRKLPLIGNLHLFDSSTPAHHTLADLAAKYGPLMHLKLGEIDTLIVSSSEVVHDVLTTHDISFANRPSGIVNEILFYKNGDLAFAPYGEYWRRLRKVVQVELLSARRVQSFQPIRYEEFSNLCRWIASKAGSSINLTNKIEWTTCDTFTRTTLGNKTNEQTMLIANIKEIAILGGGFYLPDVYPSVKVFRLFGGMRKRLEQMHKVSDNILENIINQHKAADPKRKEREDIIDILLKFNEPGHELYLTMDNIKAAIMDMFSAGIDTSSATLDWAMAEILKHPTVLKKAQDEVREVFNKKGFVDESNFDQLHYLKDVIKETLRMHPPAPLLLPRESREDCEINGYHIPAKTRVLVNAWAIGRDPKHWDDPDSFNPNRYLEDPVDYRVKNFQLIPFGGGRRICPGMTFGLANVELPLAMFLYHFDWILPDGMKPENVDVTETPGITARRMNPLYLIPIVKNPLPAAL